MPSTLTRSFTYDDERRTLEVTFVNGAVYAYYDVPAEAALAMRQAFAKGEHFNRHIRGQYRFDRLPRSAPQDVPSLDLADSTASSRQRSEGD